MHLLVYAKYLVWRTYVRLIEDVNPAKIRYKSYCNSLYYILLQIYFLYLKNTIIVFFFCVKSLLEVLETIYLRNIFTSEEIIFQ